MSKPQRLYLFQLSTASIPTPNGALAMSNGCYLVQTAAGRNILIDSGLPANYTPLPAENEQNVLQHLSALGLHPEDIDMVICTHFDIDHVGYHTRFPQAEFIVQRDHYDLACAGHPRFAASRPYWDHPALRYRFVEGDTELIPGITLIRTDGHAPAHQSVLVHLPETGPVLLAIDAVMMQRLFTPERRMFPTDDNEEQLRASTQKLLDLVEREHISLVVFGHDGDQWQTLKKSSDFYE